MLYVIVALYSNEDQNTYFNDTSGLKSTRLNLLTKYTSCNIRCIKEQDRLQS